MPSTPLAAQRLASSGVKCGSWSSGESVSQSACVTICESSMHASAGASQPLDETTSTIACSSRALFSTSGRRSWPRSRGSSLRQKWHCSSTCTLAAGSS